MSGSPVTSQQPESLKTADLRRFLPGEERPSVSLQAGTVAEPLLSRRGSRCGTSGSASERPLALVPSVTWPDR